MPKIEILHMTDQQAITDHLLGMDRISGLATLATGCGDPVGAMGSHGLHTENC
jgi:hypothetical protein